MQTLGAYNYEERYKKRSLTISLLMGAIIIILLIWPFLTYPVPPIGQEGILVNLGVIDFGQGDENAAAAAAPIAETASEQTAADEPVTEPEPEPNQEAIITPPTPEPQPEERKPQASPEQDLLRERESAAIVLRERKAAEKRAADQREFTEAATREAQRKAEQAEAQRRADSESARKAAAEAESARKSAAEAKARALRDATGSLFNGNEGSGGGKGNTGKAGNQGDPNGDPNADRLTGISSGGAGSVGGGLQSRGVVSSPKISDSSQRKGRVVISVCVDAAGRVTSAEYTQRGSTTNDEVLKELARKNAVNYKFTSASANSQCGNITYDFVVQ